MAGLLKFVVGGAMAGMGKGAQEDIKARREAALAELREQRADARQGQQLQTQRDMNREDNVAAADRSGKEIEAGNERSRLDREARVEEGRLDRESREITGMMAYADDITDEETGDRYRINPKTRKAEPITKPDGTPVKGAKGTKAAPEKVYAKDIGEAIESATDIATGKTDWNKVESSLKLAKVPYDASVLTDLKAKADAVPADEKEEPGWFDRKIKDDDAPDDYEGQQAIPLPKSDADLMPGTKYGPDANGNFYVYEEGKGLRRVK